MDKLNSRGLHDDADDFPAPSHSARATLATDPESTRERPDAMKTRDGAKFRLGMTIWKPDGTEYRTTREDHKVFFENNDGQRLYFVGLAGSRWPFPIHLCYSSRLAWLNNCRQDIEEEIRDKKEQLEKKEGQLAAIDAEIATEESKAGTP